LAGWTGTVAASSSAGSSQVSLDGISLWRSTRKIVIFFFFFRDI
jgi:hypothetical protein